jgi:hypothetical protein
MGGAAFLRDATPKLTPAASCPHIVKVMSEHFDCTFIERRIDQLIDEAIELPEGSPEQGRIDGLIGKLQDKLIGQLERRPRLAAPSVMLPRHMPF